MLSGQATLGAQALPADSARGVRVGDVIVAVDGQDAHARLRCVERCISASPPGARAGRGGGPMSQRSSGSSHRRKAEHHARIQLD
jgi:hypothetical protein